MATARKTSRKSPASTKRSRPARETRGQIAELVQKVSQMTLILENAIDGGLLAMMRSQRVSRVPLPEYAKVVGIGEGDEASGVRGRTGIVLDAQDIEGGWTYTVYFPSLQETFVLTGERLWDTGQNVPEDVIYGGGETRRVRVGADGNGTLVA
jgi:hypothetical protein